MNLLWWRPQPGMVRVSEDEWIDILQRALRAAELEAHNVALSAAAAALEAQAAAKTRAELAAVVLARRAAGAGVTFSDLEVRGLLADLPANESDASLDEATFTASIDEHIWARRLDLLTTTN